MAMHGTPVPSNPYNPSITMAPHHSHHHHSPLFDAPPIIRYPSPFVPIRLPIFAPVLWINDRIVRLLSVGDSYRNDYKGASPSTEKRRRFSDSTVESVEEGAGDISGSGAFKAQLSCRGPAQRVKLNGAKLRTDPSRKTD